MVAVLEPRANNIYIDYEKRFTTQLLTSKYDLMKLNGT